MTRWMLSLSGLQHLLTRLFCESTGKVFSPCKDFWYLIQIMHKLLTVAIKIKFFKFSMSYLDDEVVMQTEDFMNSNAEDGNDFNDFNEDDLDMDDNDLDFAEDDADGDEFSEDNEEDE